MCLEAAKCAKWKDLSNFDRGQIVMARRLRQSFCKTAGLVACSWSAVVSTVHRNIIYNHKVSK